jgi:hypothetical protein
MRPHGVVTVAETGCTPTPSPSGARGYPELMQAHIVPRFHLGRFAVPQGRNGFVSVIDKGGRTESVHVADVCTATDFYVIEDAAGNEDAVLEDMLQKVESYSARRIEQLVVREGEKPSERDRLTLSLYLVLTNMRTPRMRDHLRWLTNSATLAQFRSTLDADVPWQRMREFVFPEMTDEEAEGFRRSTLSEIDSGNLEVEFPERYYVINTMRYVVEQAFLAAQLSWTVMRAPNDSEFVIGDHAVSMYDPSLTGSRGNGLVSSPLAETVLPLDRSVAVRLTFGDDEWSDEVVGAELVAEINLRTYAWADREIYGSSQARVVAVREHARRYPQLAVKFKPRQGGLIIENEYSTVEGGRRSDVQVQTPARRRRRS